MAWSIDYRGPRHPNEEEIYVVKQSDTNEMHIDHFFFKQVESEVYRLFDIVRDRHDNFQKSSRDAAEWLLRKKNLDKIVDEDGDVLIEVVRGEE